MDLWDLNSNSKLGKAPNILKQNLFITGAGVSKSSGIPTFRGADGFWTIGSSNFTPQEMATLLDCE